MAFALSGLCLILGLIFLVAAATKLVSFGKFTQTLIEFGTPRMIAGPLGVALAMAELAVTAALLLPATAWWGSLGATFLLSVFTFAVVANLLLGRRPACNCFGQLSTTPIGWTTVYRNTALAFAAGWLAWQDADARFSALTWDIPAEARLPALVVGGFGIAIAAIAWLLVQLTKQNGRLLLRVEALEAQLASFGHPTGAADATLSGVGVGTAAPAFHLPGLNGDMLSLEALLSRGKRLLVVFSDPDCGPCTALMPRIGKWQREFSEKLNIVVISRGSSRANRRKAEEYGISEVLLQKDRETAEAYSCAGTPGALLIGSNGLVESTLAMGEDAIIALVNRTIGGQHLIAAVPEERPAAPKKPTRQQLRVGEKVPRLRLSDLKGRVIDLDSAKRNSTLLVFWNPNCGFCRTMLDDLRRWEANRNTNTPRLVLVSTGSVQDNVGMGLRAEIALDENFAVGQLFGANGTPSAILLDQEGTVASDVAVGRAEMIALVERSRVRYA
jgi:peroxiredoxin